MQPTVPRPVLGSRSAMLHCLLYTVVLGVSAATGVAAEEIAPGILRTPDERFENLPGYDFSPHYAQIGEYRVHYLDEGPRDGEVVLLLHGEPTWSYLYRKMMPVLTEAGLRCIVPDLIGFGRSDKPVSMETHTYAFHVDAMTQLVEQLDLQHATFFGQDWGGLIGLRVVAENPERFARVVIGNTGLPVGTAEGLEGFPDDSAFMQWRRVNQGMIERGDIPTGAMVARSTGDPSVAAAYDAPFPDPRYKAGALIMPQRVPVLVDDPANEANRAAWRVFEGWEKPFLTAFSDGDPVTRGGYLAFQRRVPGAQGQEHVTIEGAGHFLQEQKGPELAAVIVQFIAEHPLPLEAREQPHPRGPRTPPRGVGAQAAVSAAVLAGDIPVAHTPPGYWESMPEPILARCTEPLVDGAPDLRGTWKAISATMNGQPTDRFAEHTQRIEQCGNRVIVLSNGVTHDMRCDGTFENGVQDISPASSGGREITVACSFEQGVHVLRPQGMAITVERELDGDRLMWRYGPSIVVTLERSD